MLTPIDQPLDKLADLRPDEMYVSLLSGYVVCPNLGTLQREHEGLVRTLFQQVHRLRKASRERQCFSLNMILVPVYIASCGSLGTLFADYAMLWEQPDTFHD